MTSFQRIAIALIIFFATLELLLPDEAYAFGKQKEVLVAKPTVVRTEPKLPAIVATKPAVAPEVVQPVIKKTAIKKASRKPIKPRVTAVKTDPKIQAAKPVEPSATEVANKQTAGQQVGQAVDQSINSVSGLFDKFKASVKTPAILSTCSAAQKVMNQC